MEDLTNKLIMCFEAEARLNELGANNEEILLAKKTILENGDFEKCLNDINEKIHERIIQQTKDSFKDNAPSYIDEKYEKQLGTSSAILELKGTLKSKYNGLSYKFSTEGVRVIEDGECIRSYNHFGLPIDWNK